MVSPVGVVALLAFFYAASGPVVCLALLVQHYRKGLALPARGDAAIYVGCLMWLAGIAARAAISEPWRAWVGLPIPFGLILGAVWQRRAENAGWGRIASSAAAFAFFGLMGWVVLGGGYFDKLFQIPHAQKMLRDAGVDASDPAALGTALRHEDLWVRWGAALRLEQLGAGAAPALERLVGATQDEDPRVGRTAWNVLRALGDRAAPAAASIALLIKDRKNDWEVDSWFGVMGAKAEGAVPVLLSFTSDPSPLVRRRALEVLGRIGPAAKDAALPVLARLYKTETDPDVKTALTNANARLQIAFPEWQQALSAP